MQRETLITDREALRPGDLLRVWPDGSPECWTEGPIHEMSDGRLWVGVLLIRWSDGEWITDNFDLTEYPARRLVPPVDEAQVVALADLLEEANGNYGQAFYEDLARRLLETGRVEVKS